MGKGKSSFSKILVFATIAGAIAAGISYFTKYRSFHKELEEDFCDFEDIDDDSQIDSTMSRSYVPLNSEAGEPMPKAEEVSIEKAATENNSADISSTTVEEELN